MAKTVQELVREQVQTKISAGEELERAVATVGDKATELVTAERGAAVARRAALGAGWTEAELKSLGLADRPRPRRRTSSRTTAPTVVDGESAR